jgi:ribosome-associated protein
MSRHGPSYPTEVPSERSEEDEGPQYTKPSKSQLKRDMTALQKLGEELVEQPAERLDRIDLPESLREAVDQAREIRDHEGRRRQMQYIGRLMRDVDVEPIRAAIESWEGMSRAEAAALHALERWRERLIEDDEALTAFATEHTAALSPDTLQKLRNAIRMSRKEKSEARPPKHFRELFRLIRTIVAGDAEPPDARATDDVIDR